MGAAGPAWHRAFRDQQDGLRLPLRRAGQSGHGGRRGMDDNRQGERAVAFGVFFSFPPRRNSPLPRRARVDFKNPPPPDVSPHFWGLRLLPPPPPALPRVST